MRRARRHHRRTTLLTMANRVTSWPRVWMARFTLRLSPPALASPKLCAGCTPCRCNGDCAWEDEMDASAVARRAVRSCTATATQPHSHSHNPTATAPHTATATHTTTVTCRDETPHKVNTRRDGVPQRAEAHQRGCRDREWRTPRPTAHGGQVSTGQPWGRFEVCSRLCSCCHRHPRAAGSVSVQLWQQHHRSHRCCRETTEAARPAELVGRCGQRVCAAAT